MNRQRPIILFILALYVFAPSLLGWLVDPDGAWYRPYIIWIMVIIATFFFHRRGGRNNDV